MPNMIKSKKQNAAMHAAAAGHGTIGIPKAVAREAIATQTKPIKHLPEREGPPKKAAPPKKKPPAPRHFGSIAPPERDSDYS
jgi:hypothetical protein